MHKKKLEDPVKSSRIFVRNSLLKLYLGLVIGNGRDVSIFENGAVVSQSPQLRVHLLEGSGHQDLLFLSLR
jgi:hypothetical protein